MTRRILSMLLIAATLISCFSLCAAEADQSDPKYTITDASFDKEEMTVTGKVEHDPATTTPKRAFARITFFMSNGSFIAFAAVIDENGNFEAMASGDVVHVAVQVTDSTRVRPGEYNSFGGNEFDVE